MDEITRIQRYFARKGRWKAVCRETGTHGLGSSIGETQVTLCAPMLTSHQAGGGMRRLSTRSATVVVLIAAVSPYAVQLCTSSERIYSL